MAWGGARPGSGVKPRPVFVRLWSRVLVVLGPGCWVWSGGKTKGYGVIRERGRKGRLRLAHVVMYEMVVGPVPDGWEVDHLCRVRACVRPSHLEAVTGMVNRQRQAAARRLVA